MYKQTQKKRQSNFVPETGSENIQRKYKLINFSRKNFVLNFAHNSKDFDENVAEIAIPQRTLETFRNNLN